MQSEEPFSIDNPSPVFPPSLALAPARLDIALDLDLPRKQISVHIDMVILGRNPRAQTLTLDGLGPTSSRPFSSLLFTF